jgi:hypothetical protein
MAEVVTSLFGGHIDSDRRPRDNATMSTKPAADDPSRPNVYRLEALALREILADGSTDPDEVAHREWLKRRLEAETKKIASIPTKLDTTARREPLLADQRQAETRSTNTTTAQPETRLIFPEHTISDSL